jgi:hypothetical protein
MTLEPYNPDRLDLLALRLLDLSAKARGMAQLCREEQLDGLDLHDRKALEYLGKFEEWLYRAEAELPLVVMKHRGRRHARKVQAGKVQAVKVPAGRAK